MKHYRFAIIECMEKIYEMYTKHKKLINAILFIAVFFVVFLSVYTTPLYDDDLVYINKWKSDIPLANFKDIIEFQVLHYFNWGGRTIAHTILQVLLLMPKQLSAFINTCMFCLLGYGINKIAFKKVDGLFYLFTLAILYYLNPTYKESIMWLTGSANYLYTTVLILGALYPLTRIYRNEKVKWPYLYLPIVFLSGWCNENMSATMTLFMGITCVYAYRKKIKANWLYVYLVVEMLGLGLLLLAPGNFVRASGLPGGLMALLYRGHGQLNAWTTWLFMPLLLTLILQYINYRSDKNVKDVNWFLIGFSVISMLAMVVSPVYPQRATFGTFVILVILIIDNLYGVYQKYQKEVSGLMLIVVVACVLSLLVIGVLAYARMFNPNIGY